MMMMIRTSVWRTFLSLITLFKALLIGWSHANFNKVGSQQESKLIHYLLEHKQYNPLIRPVSNLSDTVKVDMGLALIQIINVEEKSQIMKANVWLRLSWTDYQLKWEPSDFGGVDVARVNPKRIWQPDIVLFNNADGNYEVSWQPNVLISSDGSVLWIPPAIFISSCTIHVEFFPFDKQTCEMKFGSWTFDATQLSLGYYDDKTHVDLSDYWKSGTWDLLDCPTKIVNISDASPSPETQIIFQIIIQRKTLFYTINLILPCLLISILTVCVFYLPADAGEKMTLSISILLSLIVFLLLISKILPPTSSSIPLISKFLLFTFIINIFTITITVMIINWNFRSPNTHEMSPWVRKWFIDLLPKYLMMERPEKKCSYSSRKQSPASKTNKINKNVNNNIDYIAYNPTASIYSPSFLRKSYQSLTEEYDNANGHDLDINNSDDPWSSYNNFLTHSYNDNRNFNSSAKSDRCTCTFTPNDRKNTNASERSWRYSKSNLSIGSAFYDRRKNSNKSCTNQKMVTVSERMRRAIKAINFISAHLEIENDNRRIMQDWKYVAAVLDRIHLVIFTVVTIAGTMFILLKVVYILKPVNEEELMKKYSVSSKN